MSRSSSSASQPSPVSKKDGLNSYFDMDFSMDITNKMRVPEQITLASVDDQDARSGKQDSSLMKDVSDRIVISGEEDQSSNAEEAYEATVVQKVGNSNAELG